jgi:DinB family protein
MPPTHLAMAREVEQFRQQFEQVSKDGDALVNPLSDDQFLWQPRPTAWSVAQCIEHLNTTARLYLPQLDEAISNAIRRGTYGEGPFSYNIFGRFFTAAMEPPARFKVTSPKAFQPPPTRSRAEVTAAFRAYQVQFVDRLRQANGLDLARAKVRSPTYAWLRFSLGSGFALTLAHERRHLWQARNVVNDPLFPR